MERWTQNERGSTTVEHVGLVAALGVLLAAATVGVGSTQYGRDLARATAEGLRKPVEGLATAGKAQVGSARSGSVVVGTGSEAPAMGPSGLIGKGRAGTPLRVDGYRAVSGSVPTPGGTASWCALCADADLAFGAAVGASQGASGASYGTGRATTDRSSGPGAQAAAELSVALLAAQIQANFQRTTGWGTYTAQAGADVMAGARATGAADLRITPTSQGLDAGGSAFAGAAVRAHEHTSASLLGITLSQTGGVEGWAGAGARGRINLSRERGRFTVGAAGGAALGFGGAADVQFTVDATTLLTAPEIALAPLIELTSRARRAQLR